MNIYAIINKCTFDDIFIHVFENEDLFRYSTSEKVAYDQSMIDEAFKNEQVKRKDPIYGNKVLTRKDIEDEFKNHAIHQGELTRIIGESYLFFSFADYTSWLMKNKHLNVVETFEGISC